MRTVPILIVLVLTCCSKEPIVPDSKQISFGSPQKVHVTGYDDHIMEPFLSKDGTILFFNNLNESSVNTNLHYALKINDSVFQYSGELKGINTEYLEGVPSMDDSNILYFISTRSYDQTYCTVYSGVYDNDSVSNIQIVQGISRNRGGWVNFDVEVSKDGNFFFFVDGRFDENGGPYESDLVVATKTNGTFFRTDNEILKNVNSGALEYAACISSDMLELYFNKIELPMSESSLPQIYIATRNTINESFNKPYKIDNITGFAEGPTISPDDQTIYYHKKENEKFVLYMIRKE